jgi:hypothetical protein
MLDDKFGKVFWTSTDAKGCPIGVAVIAVNSNMNVYEKAAIMMAAKIAHSIGHFLLSTIHRIYQSFVNMRSDCSMVDVPLDKMDCKVRWIPLDKLTNWWTNNITRENPRSLAQVSTLVSQTGWNPDGSRKFEMVDMKALYQTVHGTRKAVDASAKKRARKRDAADGPTNRATAAVTPKDAEAVAAGAVAAGDAGAAGDADVDADVADEEAPHQARLGHLSEAVRMLLEDDE